AWRKRAEVVLDHRMWHWIDRRARLLDRAGDREERDTDGDRDLRQTGEEGWGAEPVRAPPCGWADRHTDATWRKDRSLLRERCECEPKGPVHAARLAERVGALGAGRG